MLKGISFGISVARRSYNHMPGFMANNANGNSVASLNAQRPRDPPPELRQPGCWGKFWCLGSRKRGMRIAPARQESAGTSNAWASNGASSSTAANQFVGLSPSLLAPPSSPASFANSGNPSTVQSPAAYTVSLCVSSANACSPAFDSTATMFTIGPYAHETTLVTPPAFSAFTTAPSTAPFTPPPELAHLTTPSSPDVPFAQLLASSLKNAKGSSAASHQPAAPYSASPFASPDYVSRNRQLYPESPLANLISPASGISESGPPSPLPELEFPAQRLRSPRPHHHHFGFHQQQQQQQHQQKDGFILSVPKHDIFNDHSNNHSSELEPMRVCLPLEDAAFGRMDICTSGRNSNDGAYLEAQYGRLSYSFARDDEVREMQEMQALGFFNLDQNQESSGAQQKQEHQQQHKQHNHHQQQHHHQQHQQQNHEEEVGDEVILKAKKRRDDEDDDVDGNNSNIILKMEITEDELVKLRITHACLLPETSRLLRKKKKKKNGHMNHHPSYEDRDWSNESLDCLELDLADDTIKANSNDDDMEKCLMIHQVN